MDSRCREGERRNPGNAAHPFKTITKALGVATAAQQVTVRPGTYDVANGESFPLQIPANVALVGDEPGRGVATKIVGGVT